MDNSDHQDVNSAENENISAVEAMNSASVRTVSPKLVETENSKPVETKSCMPVETEDSKPVELENCLSGKNDNPSPTEIENTSPPKVITVENTDLSELEACLPQAETEVKNPKTSNVETEKDLIDEDFEDIDLNAIEIATNLIDKMESPEMSSAFKLSDTCENIMNACSSRAQAIKQTISDVLKSRENIVITAGNTTSEIEASLSQKIADFENIVGGCYLEETDADPKTELINIKHPAFSNVIITEVNESAEDLNLNSKKGMAAEKKPVSDITVTNNPESNSDLKTAQKKNVEDKAAETNKEPVTSTNKKNNSKEVKNAKISQIQAETIQVINAFEDDKNFKKQQKSNSNRKKGEKTIDQILKSLSNCSTTEEKLQTLCKKHLETLEESRLLEPRMKQLERQVSAQQREKEQLQAEHNRMILAKSRLESLCRELQRQNRAVKEESLMHIKAEEERRKEIASKFQVTLSEISTLMQEHSKKNVQLREENAELAKKLKALVDHYDMWEKHMEKVMQQNNLEAQLAKAKHAKVNLLLKQETEKFLREKQSLLENMSELQKKCTLLTTNELKLRTELGDYTSKYEEFQTVLNKSSQVFATFKNDMEATSKKIKKLEKETNVYKQKWESSNNALLGMISDKEKHDKEIANAHQRILTLEKLCRALQAERNELQNQINVLTDCSEKDVPSQPAETPVA